MGDRPDVIDQDHQLVALAHGFDSLLRIAQRLTAQERELSSRLQFAHDEYLKLAKSIDGLSIDTDVAAKLTPKRSETNGVCLSDPSSWVVTALSSGLISSAESNAVSQSLRARTGLAPLRRGSYGSQAPHPSLSTHASRVQAAMERDFTSNGAKGNLRCPFRPPPGIGTGQTMDVDACGQDLDPIKAEFHPDDPSISSASQRDVVARCPIRYLDNHSSQEIAQYFENHKHELPRSHAICIQRYGRDSQSVRQLDQKYGDMVNMIKDLGASHQPFLPDSKLAHNGTNDDRVGKWAEDVVSAKPAPPEDVTTPNTLPARSDKEAGPTPDAGDDSHDSGRTSYFDRPLRDVRVGESPSRPWGIHVPLDRQAGASSIVSSVAHVSPAVRTEPPPHPESAFGGTTGTDRLGTDVNVGVDAEPLPAPAKATDKCPVHMGAAAPAAVPATESNADGPRDDLSFVPMEAVPAATDRGDQGSFASHNDDQTKSNNEETPNSFASTPRPSAKRVSGSGSQRLDPPPLVQPQPQPQSQPALSPVVFNGPVFFGYSAEQTCAFIQQLGKSGMAV